MLVVVAVGRSALIPRGEALTAHDLRARVRTIARAVAPVAARHRVVLGLGNGRQLSLLTLEAAAYAKAETGAIDVLSGHADSVIGCMLEQELAGFLPADQCPATVLTMTEVSPDDPAFKTPTQCIGPVYLREEAESLARRKGWMFKPDGDKWRRVIALPEPTRILELQSIKWLLERNVVVIAQGGSMPAIRDTPGAHRLSGVGCVVNSDLTFELLARELGAEALVLLTGADAVYVDWGRANQRGIRRASPAALGSLPLRTGSIGSKVDAACRFATLTGKNAAIGAIADLAQLITGDAGTSVSRSADGITYASERQVFTAAVRSLNQPRQFGSMFRVNAPASSP
jgi:carbamate kinase